MKDIRIWFLCVCLAMFTSCSSRQQAEPIDLPTEVLDDALSEEVFKDSNAFIEFVDCPNPDWWLIFEDDQLTEFIQIAFERNPTLQAAHANMLLAAANAARAGSVLYPQINWAGDVSREKLSETGVIPFGAAPPGTTNNMVTTNVPIIPTIPVYFTQYETELTLNYDFDLWGRNRNILRAAVGEMRASVADEVFTRLKLGIALAQTYFRLQVNYKRAEIAKALIENRQQYLDLIIKRLLSNLANGIQISQIQSDISNAKQMLTQIQRDIAVQEYQLKTYLAGNFQEEIDVVEVTQKPLPKIPVPVDLPLNLISQRPDIVSQLWIIQSADRQIDAAKAGFYPNINLAALFGYQTIHFRDFFDWKSSFFNVNPAFSLPIFDGGRLLANLRGSQVNYDLAIFEYNNLVLNASKEVLEGLAILRNNEREFQQSQEKVYYLNRISYLTKLRLERHLSSSLDVLNAQSEALAAELQEIALKGETLQAALSLIKALGGGYSCE